MGTSWLRLPRCINHCLRARRTAHQRRLRCWQNPLGCCHDCRSARHGSVLDNHDCHKGKCCCACFVKHFLRLGLPESINCLVGRLVGYVEMKKGPANQTALDIPPAFRNDVLRSKRVIVGCGGGFHQECQTVQSSSILDGGS